MWSDGKKTVRLCIERKDLDTLADEAITATSGDNKAALTIVGLGAGQQKLHLRLDGLSDEITGAAVTRKKGKDAVVLKLQKKTGAPCHTLITSEWGLTERVLPREPRSVLSRRARRCEQCRNATHK